MRPNNRLLVTATDEQFKEIEQVVRTLDVGPEKGQREMGVFAVESKSAGDLIALTTQLMAQLGEDQANPQLAPKLIPDASGKQIIVLATPRDLARVTNLLHQLDSASATATARQFKGLELFSRSAAELTPLVQQLYLEQLKGQPDPAGGPATLLPDTKNNRIMVSGSDKEIARVESHPPPTRSRRPKRGRDETRVIRLKAALAAELATLVEKSLSAQAHQVKVLVDTRSNSLVVTGESGAVEAAAQIIQQLDTQSDVQPRELRLIELKSAEASTRGADGHDPVFGYDPRSARARLQAPDEDRPGPDRQPSDCYGQQGRTESRLGSGRAAGSTARNGRHGPGLQTDHGRCHEHGRVVSNAMVRFDARNRRSGWSRCRRTRSPTA